MKKAIVVAVFCLVGCKKTKIKECEDLVATAAKIEKCESIPAANRESIKKSIGRIQEALKTFEDVGDRATKEQLDMLAGTCKRQHDMVRELYAKSAPECLK